MFDEKYDDWNHKRVKAIINHYGAKWFYGKKILDLGCGKGEIAAQFSRLGADITCVDARQENLDDLKRRFPHLRVVRANLETDWPFSENFDMIFSLGLLCHLKNYESHIENICIFGDHIVLETEVCDTDDINCVLKTFEEKVVNDLSFCGEGSILSAANIQRRLSDVGATFKRLDETNLNSHHMEYGWQEKNTGMRHPSTRRMWFVNRNKYLAQQFANNRSTKFAEEDAIRKANEMVKNRNYPAYPQRPSVSQIVPSIPTIVQRKGPPLAPPMTNMVYDKIRLFYNYYEDKNITRKSEIDFCFQKNKENIAFELINVQSEIKPTFNIFFDKINELSGPDDINIICNSDIFFDETILLAHNIPHNMVYALTRWNWKSENNIDFFNLNYSQDAWILRGKIKNVDGDIQLGNLGCDSRIAYEFDKAGYKVKNPSKSIKAFHYHNSNIRNYTIKDDLPGPRLSVDPTELSKSIFALTSMSPRVENFARQKECIQSWINAGCEVISFQSPYEIKLFKANDWPGVQFVEIEPSKLFSPFIPISSMVRWASKREGYIFLINSDCNLCVNSVAMRNFSKTSDNGLVYLIRHDVSSGGNEIRQNCGIDGFLFPTKYSSLIPSSDILCMGKPWWDYVVPMSILRGEKSIASPSYKVMQHIAHVQRWANHEWQTCASEAFRVLDWKKAHHEMYPEIIKRSKTITDGI